MRAARRIAPGRAALFRRQHLAVALREAVVLALERRVWVGLQARVGEQRLLDLEAEGAAERAQLPVDVAKEDGVRVGAAAKLVARYDQVQVEAARPQRDGHVALLAR